MLQFNTALQATAAATGAQQDDLLAGAEKYQELTGRFGEFEAALDSFAKVQVATGASMESLATTAAALSDNLHVDPGQMLQVFDILASQGKIGPGLSERSHTADEHILLSEIRDGVRGYIALIERLSEELAQ